MQSWEAITTRWALFLLNHQSLQLSSQVLQWWKLHWNPIFIFWDFFFFFIVEFITGGKTKRKPVHVNKNCWIVYFNRAKTVKVRMYWDTILFWRGCLRKGGTKLQIGETVCELRNLVHLRTESENVIQVFNQSPTLSEVAWKGFIRSLGHPTLWDEQDTI